MSVNRVSDRIMKLALAVVAGITVTAGSVAPVAAGSNDEQGPIVVKLAEGADLTSLTGRVGVASVETLVASRGLYQFELGAEGRKSKDLAKDMAKLPGVEWAEPVEAGGAVEDDRFHAWPYGLPGESSEDQTIWLHQPNLDFLRLDEVHRRADGSGVSIAVLDTGVDLDHPSLAAHLAADPDRHYDFVDDDPLPMEEANGVDDDGDGRVDESFGHGTHTAGLVALIAPRAELLIYRVLDDDGSGNPYVVAEAIDEAVAAGADVINLSFGMDGKPKSKVLKEAFKNAAEAEVVIVAAVGNNSDDGDRFPTGQKNIIGVAATADGDAFLAGFSNYGKRAMVAAPGVDIISTLPGGGFGAWSGTSMAAPIVTGQAALIRSDQPDLKAKKVGDLIGKSARKLRGNHKIDKGVIDILASFGKG
ncbi:MAG: S8 family serine peptidase [Acidimicrobiales bacterium]